MNLLKTRASRQTLLIVTGLFLSLFAVKPSIARENESLKAEPKTAITTGIASWYHDKFHGRKTANGDTFSQNKLTCASNKYPLGTWLRVTNLRNGKSVLVKVNDRMSPRVHRTVDLSRLAAQKIGIEKSGIGKVTVESFGKKKPTA